jgi:hypothetical protein
MGIGLEHQETPGSGIVDKFVEPTKRGDGAREDASAIILAGDIGLFRPPTAWMAATVVSSSPGERDAVIVAASPAGVNNQQWLGGYRALRRWDAILSSVECPALILLR